MLVSDTGCCAQKMMKHSKKQGVSTRTHPAKSHRQQRYVQQGVPRRELPVFRCLHDEPVPPAIGKLAFAKRSAAMKAPVGLLSGSAVCDSRWRGVAPTSATPTRSHRKCRRIEEVKSRWNTRFSRIENLWPQDGSCPLPLRSKPFLGNCFRIVKAQKISRGCAARVC